MAMTMPALGKALEDLTKAYNDLKKELKDNGGMHNALFLAVEKSLKAVQAAVSVDDFITGQKEKVLTDSTPVSLQGFVQTVKDEDGFILVANGLDVFKTGTRYGISSDFRATTYVIPYYAQIVCMSNKRGVLSESDKIQAMANGSISLEFLYEPDAPDEEISLNFVVGNNEGEYKGEVEWSNIKIETISFEFSQNQKEMAQKALDAHVEKTEHYHNVIRNKNGSIAVPNPQGDNEAANMKFVKEEIKAHLAELVDNAPEELDTLKELADALKANEDGMAAINAALTNRYTKTEADEAFIKKAAFALHGTTLEITL
ncbi:hypothetical protein HPJ96_11005 [Treponema phagedenis]|nr:hypothetical protein HPJ96_11005 [Treponema phagedenis]